MACPTGRKRSAPDSEGSAVTTAIKRRRRTDFGNSSMITRSQTLSAARNAVLHTTELLENILYFLPMKDLLFAQRVCTKWRELIQRSIPLQQALFFLPRELGVYWKLVEEDDKLPKAVKISKEQYMQGSSGEVFQMAIPNEMLCDTDRTFELWNWPSRSTYLLPQPSGTRPEASWRRMLFAQAPFREFKFYYEHSEEPGRESVRDCTLEMMTSPTKSRASDLMAHFEATEAEGRYVDWDSHELTFPSALYGIEEEINVDEVDPNC
ncbi:hypothetical protein D0863_09881 [Hortaea werneckii]|uniref:F-box domain-containing protein n=1 Tax=Hortaea werneckii TaxID=91943 RepID=A0A3M7DK87_HORWE|nr:hypothetical protein D0863_09881 [Hortaea werneckii]